MVLDKKPSKEIVGKLVVTKEGKRLGVAKDITFETRTGELIQLVLAQATPFVHTLNLERTREKDFLVPYNSIIAIGDFIVVSEEDIV
ncbi:PRC-barrel domain-containing protein [Candidatus Pacearchaeota archaeon]|nr:PRC-barrel domain-containing protein [Candidatus Pacearchaeota archaeon]